MSQAIAPLRIPRFRALWAASIASNVGSFLQTVAGAWLMLELTGSATWVALMVASTTLPLLFLALVAGAVADFVDRSKVLLATQSLMGAAATAMAVVTAAGAITPGILLSLSLVVGVGIAFNLPAWQAMVPDLVPRGMVASAVALNSVAFNAARAVGPALGGLVVATAGPEVAFGLNALSYVGIIGVLAVLARDLRTAEPQTSSVGNAIALGVRFARFTRPFRMILLLVSLFAITSAVVQAVLPNLTEDLDGGAGTYGVLLGAMGVGALIAAFTRQAVVNRLGRRSLPATVALFGLAGIGTGAAPTVAVAAAALVVAGMAWVWTLTTTNATAQLMSPPWVRGRAMSLYTLAFTGITPLGSILGGIIADGIGAGPSMVLLSTGSVMLGIAATRFRIPALAEVKSPEFTGGHAAPEHAATEGGPVMVVNTWIISEEDVESFLKLMKRVRRIRLRTGAYEWRLYRNTDDPHRLSEVFHVVSWEEHLAQHRRIDDAAAIVIREARSYDRSGGPLTRHLIAVDVERPADWDALLAAHEEYHGTDGSIPLEPASIAEQSG